MSSQAPKYRFRVLDIPTLVSQLVEIGINVTAADLENPQPAIVSLITLKLSMVDAVMGPNGSDRDGPRFSALEHMEHPELHEESLLEARFNANLRRIMEVAGVHDFSYTRDVHTPVKQRLKVHISALINLVLYRLTKLATFSEKALEAEQISERRQQVELETQQAQSNLRQLRQQQEREEPILRQLGDEIDEHAAVISQANNKQAQLKLEHNNLKAQCNERTDKISELKVVITNHKQEMVKLQSMILQSPEKVKRNMDDMEHSLESVRTAIAESGKRSEELKARYVHCGKIEKDIRKCMALLSEIEQESNKYKKLTKQVKELKARKIELQKQLQEILTNEQSVERNINSYSEKSSKLARTNAARREQAEQALKDIKEEKVKIEKEQSVLKPKLDQQAMEVLQVQQQITERWQEYEKTEREELARYRKLVDSVQKYLYKKNNRNNYYDIIRE